MEIYLDPSTLGRCSRSPDRDRPYMLAIVGRFTYVSNRDNYECAGNAHMRTYTYMNDKL